MKSKLHDGHLGRSQLAVIDDILAGLNEREAIRKNHVSPYRYRKWLKNPLFKREFADRKESLHSRLKFILISSLPKAARRLAELINSEKDEIARKACIDIINIQKADEEKEKTEQVDRAERQSHQPQISEAKAAKIWAIMAEPDEPQTEPIAGITTGGMARSDAEFVEAERGHDNGYSNCSAYSLPVQAATRDVLTGAAVCGIESSLLAEAFPDGIPAYYLEKLRQVAISHGSNPDMETSLKSRVDAQASIERKKRLMRTC